jgi:hypothetical protein
VSKRVLAKAALSIASALSSATYPAEMTVERLRIKNCRARRLEARAPLSRLDRHVDAAQREVADHRGAGQSGRVSPEMMGTKAWGIERVRPAPPAPDTPCPRISPP